MRLKGTVAVVAACLFFGLIGPAGATTLFDDDFNRANLGANWDGLCQGIGCPSGASKAGWSIVSSSYVKGPQAPSSHYTHALLWMQSGDSTNVVVGVDLDTRTQPGTNDWFNAGLVLNYKATTDPSDNDAYAFCKAEVTPKNDWGQLSIGDSNGVIDSIKDNDGDASANGNDVRVQFDSSTTDHLETGDDYHLSFMRYISPVTGAEIYACTVSGGTLSTQYTIEWHPATGETSSYSSSKKHGLRVKVANDLGDTIGSGDNEDSGATRFDNFTARSITP